MATITNRTSGLEIVYGGATTYIKHNNVKLLKRGNNLNIYDNSDDDGSQRGQVYITIPHSEVTSPVTANINDLYTTVKGYVDINNNIEFVSSKSDLPLPSGGVITLEANKTYYFIDNVDLTGDRLVGGQNTTILGTSSENASITSTGLGTGLANALLTTQWTAPVRNITFKDVDTALNIDGNTNPPVALDWTGVNFLNVPNIGTINTCDNFIYTKGAFLNSKGFTLTGTHGTVAINQSLLSGDGNAGNIITIDASCTITRRFRIIYSSIIAFGSTVGLNVSASATIPAEGYILDTVNFGGGGTYTSGVTYLDNKVRWDGNKGIVNTSEFANYYMTNNATPTVITLANTAYKILGSTTPNTINQKFTHTDNRVTYTGEIIRDFEVTAIISFTTGNNKVIGLYVAKNGSILPESEMYATASGSGRAESISIQTVLNLQENDYVEIWIENETDTTNVTVEYLNATIKALN